jgi:hypothetical protein
LSSYRREFIFKEANMAYFNLNCKISIADKYFFSGLTSVEIKKSVFSLIETCTLEMPTHYKVKDKKGEFTREEVASILPKGQKVVIELGYNGNLRKEFDGYIVEVQEGFPLKIRLEGQGYLLRQINPKPKSFKTTMKEVLEYVLSGTGITLNQNIPTVEVRNFLIKGGHNALWVISDLIEKYPLVAYFRDNELLVGLTQQYKSGLVKYDLNKNVIEKDSLKWRDKEPMQVTMEIIDSGQSKIIHTGDPNGKSIKLKETFNMRNEDLARKYLESKLHGEINLSGYGGTFETFLLPNVEPAFEAHIINPYYPKKNGAYFVTTVTTKMSKSGARRTVEVNGRLIL